jgi:hypothetical protein
MKAQIHLGTIGLVDIRGPVHPGDDANGPNL